MGKLVIGLQTQAYEYQLLNATNNQHLAEVDTSVGNRITYPMVWFSHLNTADVDHGVMKSFSSLSHRGSWTELVLKTSTPQHKKSIQLFKLDTEISSIWTKLLFSSCYLSYLGRITFLRSTSILGTGFTQPILELCYQWFLTEYYLWGGSRNLVRYLFFGGGGWKLNFTW